MIKEIRSAFARHPRDRAIAALAVPALGALAMDPLVSIIDTAWVGRLGTKELAALAIASAVFAAVFSVFNFVHLAVTPLVAGEVGRGDTRRAGAVATAGLLVSVLVGLVVAIVAIALASVIANAFGADAGVSGDAASYLRVRFLALPAMLVALVGHGIYRGHSDTRTPLRVAFVMNAINVVLDPLLIFGFDLGVVGAAWATVIAQYVAAVMFVVMMFVTHRERLGMTTDLSKARPLGVGAILSGGWPLMIRSAALLTAITASTFAATRIGTVEVAAHQIAMQVWLFLAFVLDSYAIAAQAMVGTDLGAGRVDDARSVSNRLLALGFITGSIISVAWIAASPWLGAAFGAEPPVESVLRTIYPIVWVLQPITALVYVWDGIGIGASAFRYLAVSMVIAAVAAVMTMAVLGDSLFGVWMGLAVLSCARLGSFLWWHRTGPLARERGPLPASRAV